MQAFQTQVERAHKGLIWNEQHCSARNSEVSSQNISWNSSKCSRNGEELSAVRFFFWYFLLISYIFSQFAIFQSHCSRVDVMQNFTSNDIFNTKMHFKIFTENLILWLTIFFIWMRRKCYAKKIVCWILMKYTPYFMTSTN